MKYGILYLLPPCIWDIPENNNKKLNICVVVFFVQQNNYVKGNINTFMPKSCL